ncbi:helix-turn-helix domain-containing protein [Streptomyces sp. NRRL S-1521]|uniref:helix-turn-helix domain-containing protein n=1 Tax=Streptomyces sp. NRRL S-1521 TaxID=1609100 RepID=UPI00099EED8D|nr:helix-turn-helix transcriptional regulator [Streptomyces sp. NRRL S-1521]
MPPKDQALACAGPGCANPVSQTGKPRPGRPSLYCSDACGRAYRKLSDQMGESDHDAYAEQVAGECVDFLEHVKDLLGAGRPLEALQQIMLFDCELRDLTAAAVVQARGHKKKSTDIADALNVGTDNISRNWSIAATARRRRRRAERRQQPPTESPPVRAAPGRRPPHRTPHPGVSRENSDAAGLTGAQVRATDLEHPGQVLARALSQVQRTSDMTLRALGKEAGVSASYISRVLTGDRLPSWRITRVIAAACGADPADLKPLWNEARGLRPAEPVSLFSAIRGLVLADANPSAGQLSSRLDHALSADEIHNILAGVHVPEWEKVGQLVSALHGQPETIRPLWAAASPGPFPTSTFAGRLPAGAFG